MEFILSFSFTIIFLVLGVLSGGIIFSLMGLQMKSRIADFFFRLLTGICSLVFLYAMVKSNGRSTLLMLLLPALMLFLKFKKVRKNSFISGILPSAKGFAIAVFIVGAIILFLQYFYESFTMQQDSANYLKISESLRLTGLENTRHFKNVYSNLFNGVEPYHYFEMWLAAAFMDLSHGSMSHLNCLRLCSYGLIIAMVVIGVLSIYESAGLELKAWHLAMAFLFLFFVPNISQLIFSYDKHFNFPIECNLINRLNFRTYWLFLIPVFLFAIRKDFFSATLSLFFLPVISITTAPAILGCIGLLILLNRWTKFYAKRDWIQLVCSLLVCAIGFVFIFSIFKIKSVGALYSFTGPYILNYFMSSWKAVLGAILMEGVNLLFVFGPFAVLLTCFVGGRRGLREFVQEHRFLLVLVLLINSCGILFFQAASFMNNAYQFAFIGFCSLAIMVFVSFNFLILKIERKYMRVSFNFALGLFLVFSALRLVGINSNSIFTGHDFYSAGTRHGYSQEYLNSVAIEMKNIQSNPGAFIGDSAYYNKLYYSKRLPDFYFPGISYFIFGKIDNSYQFCLSDTNSIYFGYTGTKRDFLFLKQAVASSLFHHDFMYGEKKSIGEMRKDAIEKFHIQYLILTPGVKSDAEWDGMIARHYKDAQTGEQFLVLHK